MSSRSRESLVSQGDRGAHCTSELIRFVKDQSENDLDNMSEHDSTPEGQSFAFGESLGCSSEPVKIVRPRPTESARLADDTPRILRPEMRATLAPDQLSSVVLRLRERRAWSRR